MTQTFETQTGSPVSKSFAGGVSGALGFIITIGVVLVCCCTSIIIGGVLLVNKYREDTNNFSISDNTPIPTLSPSPAIITKYKLGDSATSGDVVVTLFNVADNAKSGNQFIKPKKDFKYYCVEVQVTYTGNNYYMQNQLDFKLKDSTNIVYSTSFVEIKTPDLAMQKISKGEGLRGWITFEIPSNLNDLQLLFNSTFIKDKEVVFDL